MLENWISNSSPEYKVKYKGFDTQGILLARAYFHMAYMFLVIAANNRLFWVITISLHR